MPLVPITAGYGPHEPAARHHMNEWLLEHTLDDMLARSRLDAPLYELLGLSALLRKTLIDGSPLADSARTRLRLPKPTFQFTPFTHPGSPSPDLQLYVAFAQDDFTSASVSADLQRFRKATCGYFRATPVSVEDVIKYFANTHGGVHAGRADSEFEREVQALIMSLERVGQGWARILVRIAIVTERALRPIVDAIQADPASPPTVPPELLADE